MAVMAVTAVAVDLTKAMGVAVAVAMEGGPAVPPVRPMVMVAMPLGLAVAPKGEDRATKETKWAMELVTVEVAAAVRGTPDTVGMIAMRIPNPWMATGSTTCKRSCHTQEDLAEAGVLMAVML